MSAPMVVAAARALCRLHAVACNVNEADLWNLESDWFKSDASEALAAAGMPEMLEVLQCARTVLFLLSDEVAALGLRAENVPQKVADAINKAGGSA
jgi:hypothetical protein